MVIDAENVIKELVAKGIRLPPQPGVLLELQKKLASDDYSMSDLSHIISSDPGITAMLFKAARSPVFSSGKKFNSIEQVLMVIGLQQTYNLIQAISLSTNLTDATRKVFDIFWTRSHEVAQIASLIALDRVSVCNIFPDQAYMAGIFYDCGVPILMQRFPDYCSKLNVDSSACWPVLAEEDALFNVDHCTIGYLVALHWKLPDFICKAIMSRQEIPHEELGAVRSLVAILQLAVHLYCRITRTEHPFWQKIRKDVLMELGIHLDTEQEYYEEITEQFLAGA
jgi:HD-like signal output (HDOD) protein